MLFKSHPSYAVYFPFLYNAEGLPDAPSLEAEATLPARRPLLHRSKGDLHSNEASRAATGVEPHASPDFAGAVLVTLNW